MYAQERHQKSTQEEGMGGMENMYKKKKKHCCAARRRTRINLHGDGEKSNAMAPEQYQ